MVPRTTGPRLLLSASYSCVFPCPVASAHRFQQISEPSSCTAVLVLGPENQLFILLQNSVHSTGNVPPHKRHPSERNGSRSPSHHGVAEGSQSFTAPAGAPRSQPAARPQPVTCGSLPSRNAHATTARATTTLDEDARGCPFPWTPRGPTCVSAPLPGAFASFGL